MRKNREANVRKFTARKKVGGKGKREKGVKKDKRTKRRERGRRGGKGKSTREKGNRGTKGRKKGTDKGKGKTNNNKPRKTSSYRMNRSAVLTSEEVRDYRWAMNQKRKAKRIEGWFSMLGKKVNKSLDGFFHDAAEFFSSCPEGSPLYQHLR